MVQICPKCQQHYTLDNPPKKLINCEHCICLNCLQIQILCPVDHRRIQRRKYTIQAFETHQELLSVLTGNKITKEKKLHCEHEHKHVLKESSNNKQNKQSPQLEKKTSFESVPQFQTCLLHSKKAELVCLQDKCLICPNCGLFGQHKAHTLLPYDRFALSFGSVTEQCLKINQQLKTKQNKISQKHVQARIEVQLKLKRQKQTEKITQFMFKLNQKVKSLEKTLYNSLQIAIQDKRTQILRSLSVQSINSRIQTFQKTVQTLTQGITDVLNVRSIDKYVKYINVDEEEKSFITTQGESLLNTTDEKYGQIIDSIKIEVQTDILRYKDVKDDVFQGMFWLSGQQENKPEEKTKNTQEESLLQQIQHQDSYNMNQESLSPIAPVDSPDMTFDDPMMATTYRPSFTYARNSLANTICGMKQVKKNNMNRSVAIKKSLNSSCQGQKEMLHLLNQRQVAKRKKKLDLPEKYMKIYEQLVKDHLDVLDLGGASLGDTAILQIVQLLPSRLRIKTVKLMNNKLTDDVLPELLSHCKTVCTLNLSYNSFTQTALTYLQQSWESLGNLENITLSHNKIVLRHVKDRIQELKRLGVKVSL